MADERFELEDGEVVPSFVHGPAAAADVQLRSQLHETATSLRRRGQRDLARLALGLVDADPINAMWVLSNNDQARGGGGGGGDFSGDPMLYDAFRHTHTIRRRLLNLQTAGHEISEAFPPMLLAAAQHAAHLVITYDIVDETTQHAHPYRDGGFGAVPASAAAVRSLEKQTFRADGGAGVTDCSICFEEFTDGAQVTVMPCPSHEHKFHPDCILKWLAISNMCPLCRCEV